MTQFSDRERSARVADMEGEVRFGEDATPSGDAVSTRAASDGGDASKGQTTSSAAYASPRTSPALAPSRQRQFLVTLVGVYPIITALLYLVLPLTAGWPIWQTTLIVAPLMVAIMVFWMIPTIQKRFGRFIMVPARG